MSKTKPFLLEVESKGLVNFRGGMCFASTWRLLVAMQFSIFKWRPVKWKGYLSVTWKLNKGGRADEMEKVAIVFWLICLMRCFYSSGECGCIGAIENEEWVCDAVETLQRFNPSLTVASNALEFRLELLSRILKSLIKVGYPSRFKSFIRFFTCR